MTAISTIHPFGCICTACEANRFQPIKADPVSAVEAPTMPETYIGEREYMRGLLSRKTVFRLIVSGPIGPRELTNLISLLATQAEVLSGDTVQSEASES